MGSKEMLLIECYKRYIIIKLTVIISTYSIQHYLVTICRNTDNVKLVIISINSFNLNIF